MLPHTGPSGTSASVLRDADDGEQREHDVGNIQVDARQAHHNNRRNACGALPARRVLHDGPQKKLSLRDADGCQQCEKDVDHVRV